MRTKAGAVVGSAVLRCAPVARTVVGSVVRLMVAPW